MASNRTNFLSRMNHFNKIKLNFFYSAIILALLSAIVLTIFSPRPNVIFRNTVSTGIIDSRFIMFLMLRYFALWSGIIVLLLRLLRVIKNKHSFLYIFISSLNIILGVSGIYFFGFKYISIGMVHMFIINLIIGVIILTDIFLLHIILNNSTELQL